MPNGTSEGRETAKLALIVVLWAALFRLLSLYGVDLIPRTWAHELTLEAYLAIVQVVTAFVGLALCFSLLRDPLRALALEAPSGLSAFRAAALAPLAFVVSTAAAFQIARPTLLEELARGGAAAVRQNAGEFGREVVASPLWMALAWGALVSPIAEELFFRGAFFSLVARLTRGWLRNGAAALIVAVAFGVLHRDMPGGMGIVRFVSALGLGLACGIARQQTGSVMTPILVHVLFNTLSITAARRLIVSDVFPVKSAVPTLAMLFAAVGLVALISERAVRRPE